MVLDKKKIISIDKDDDISWELQRAVTLENIRGRVIDINKLYETDEEVIFVLTVKERN